MVGDSSEPPPHEHPGRGDQGGPQPEDAAAQRKPSRSGDLRSGGSAGSETRAEQSGSPAGSEIRAEQAAARHAVIDPVAVWEQVLASPANLAPNETQQLGLLNVLDDITRYADGLRRSPAAELDGFVHALAGGYVPPSSGGDPLVNPESVPTGRNLYGLNAETAPTEEAWRVGQQLVEEILARHRAQTGHYPKQVAFSLWGSEFARTKGTGIAQILYLLGVRPLRNSRGAVYDVELIPSAELGRPRIDVLVQTSGQFRDAAASRITLIDKAVRMVGELGEEPLPNFVRDGSTEAEMQLKSHGYAPKEARELSTARIFGSADNQSYGTGIMGLVERGDTWQNEQEVADRYVRNMGGVYRDGETWGTFKRGVLEAQMPGTEVVVHSRSSNTWGPLSLDHVYEFMGGISLSIRAKTRVDPTGYFSDQRNRDRAQATTAVAAVREEARTTLWNPKFLQGLQREGPSAAATLAETVRNLYGWNVMQPAVIDKAMWDETYQVLVADKHALGMRQYFEQKNPFALQDLTSIMLETARKGYWTPSSEVLQRLAATHAELVAKYGAACSYETCGNRSLQEFLQAQLNAPGSEVPAPLAAAYQANLAAVLQSARSLPEVQGITLDEKKERIENIERASQPADTVLLAGGIVLFVVGTLAFGLRRPRTVQPKVTHRLKSREPSGEGPFPSPGKGER